MLNSSCNWGLIISLLAGGKSPIKLFKEIRNIIITFYEYLRIRIYDRDTYI